MLLAHTQTCTHMHMHTHTLSLLYIYICITVYPFLTLCIVAENTDGFRYRFTHMHIDVSVLTYLDLWKHWESFSTYYNHIRLQFDHLCIFKVHKLLFQREVRNAHHWYLNDISIPNNISIHISTWTHTHAHIQSTHMHTRTQSMWFRLQVKFNICNTIVQ